MPRNPWLVKGRLEELAKLWEEGRSASWIAAHFGEGISRNAVIGKVNRLKLSPRRSNSSFRRPKAKRQRVNRVKAQAQKKLSPVGRLFYGPRNPSEPLPIPPPAASDIPRVHFRDLDEKPITIIEADGTIRTVKRHCKWVVGEPSDGMYCGDERVEGLSYCRAHAMRAYAPAGYTPYVPSTPGLQIKVLEELEQLQPA